MNQSLFTDIFTIFLLPYGRGSFQQREKGRASERERESETEKEREVGGKRKDAGEIEFQHS